MATERDEVMVQAVAKMDEAQREAVKVFCEPNPFLASDWARSLVPVSPEMEFRKITQPEINRSRSALLESLRRS